MICLYRLRAPFTRVRIVDGRFIELFEGSSSVGHLDVSNVSQGLACFRGRQVAIVKPEEPGTLLALEGSLHDLVQMERHVNLISDDGRVFARSEFTIVKLYEDRS